MNKKIISVILASVIAGTAFFTGCENKSSDSTAEDSKVTMHDAFNNYIDSISLQDIIECKNESYFYTI